MPSTRAFLSLLPWLVILVGLGGCSKGRQGPVATDPVGQIESPAQPRPAGARVAVPLDRIRVGDGDTIAIQWDGQDTERVRILGIDTPETRNPEHNLPYDQPFGREATAFAKGVFAASQKVELLRAPEPDRYGRTLGYVFVDGLNYSVLVIRAGLAVETVTHYGDNGFPEEAAAVKRAAASVGPAPFEAPFRFRGRMRDVSEWMRNAGERN